MADVNLALTEGETRSWKLVYLIIKGSTLVLKYRFDQGTAHRKAFLTEEKPNLIRLVSKNALTKAQFSVLYPASGTSSSANYDITLLVALHRTCLCAKKENDPVWSFGNTPHRNDHSVEADIVRLRDARNEFLHQPLPELTKAEFNTKWQDVCQVLLRLGKGISGLENTLERLRSECFDKEYENQLLGKLKEWDSLDKSFGDEMMRTIQGTSQCANAIDRSKQELSNVLDDKFFVETHVFKKARMILRDNGIVVLTGPVGAGKSTNGIKLVEDLNKCLKLNKSSDWDSLNTSIVDTVFIDDIFGDKFDKGDSRKWQKIFPQIDHYVKRKILKVIITSRTYIMKEALESLNVSHLINDSNTVTMTSTDLTETEKKEILLKHIEMNGRKLSIEKVTDCINAVSKSSSFPVGFPECARIFCQRVDLFRQGDEFFESPITHIKQCLSEIFKKDEKVFLAFFVLWAQKPQKIHSVKLEQTFASTPKSILAPIEHVQFRPEKELRTIKTSLISHSTDFIFYDKRKEIFTFSHRVISDVFGLVAYEKNGTAVLKYCPSSFIERFIRIDDKDVQGEEKECMGLEIIIPPSRFDALSERIGDILVEVNGGLIKEESDCIMSSVDLTWSEDRNESPTQYIKCFPLLFPVFHNKSFCERFFKDTMKEKAIQILTTPITTVEDELKDFEKIVDESICKADICLLAYLVKHSMTEFKDLVTVCHKEMKPVDNQPDTVSSILKANLLIALLLAVKRSHREMVEHLVNLGAPVNDRNAILTALAVANREIVTLLLQGGEKEICCYKKDGKSPLRIFIEDDNVEAVKCILSLNSCKDEIDTTLEDDPNHDTLLHKACRKGQDEVVKQMLVRSPNVLSRNVSGFCPIHEAALAGKVDTVKVLLQHNRKQADYLVNLTDKLKRIKLYHLAVYRQDADLIDMLEELNIPVDCTDEVKQHTPFMFALEERKCDVVKRLVDLSVRHGVQNATDYRGHTALHIAIEKLQELTNTPDYDIYLEIIGQLLREGDKNVNFPNEEGKSAFQLAEEGHLHEVVDELKRNTNLKRVCSDKGDEACEAQNSSILDETHNHTPAKRVTPCD